MLESKFKWFPTKSFAQEEYALSISEHQLKLQDTSLQFSSTTEINHDIFEVEVTSVRPFEYLDRAHIAFTFEMNLNLLVTERTVYGALDFIGNVGGLYDGLLLFFGLIVSFLNYKFY